MLIDALKGQIQALPSDQFVRFWECVEEIEGSLTKAGRTAVLALTYTRAVQEAHLAELLVMQQARIANMTQSAINQQENVVALATSRNEGLDKIAKLEKQLARLKAPKKTKRKA